ncbi:MAG: hypothetical protein M0Q94_15295, partial [Candidatus Cloacimonetes bacterium]|nr:hypothetical protein [Candidatus Cloacimonadota bacterium]
MFIIVALVLVTVQPGLAEMLVSNQNSEDITFNLNLDAGWNLISIPLILDNNSVRSVFGQIETLDEVPVQFWDGQQFVSAETIEPLTGYFVYTEDLLSIELQGSKVQGRTKHLKTGWNMIGGYRTNYPLDLSKIPNQDSQCPSLRLINGQYVESHELAPGDGAWVFVKEDTTIDDNLLKGLPEIEILSPLEDVYKNETIILMGHLLNTDADTVQIDHNGNDLTVPVSNYNFSVELDLAETNTISLYVTENGIAYSKEILLDGDHLWGDDERALGFNPLNPDSDCAFTDESEAGNGIVDGYEIFDGNLPVFAKVKIGADPFAVDTDLDGLTDYFELMKLGVIPGGSSQSAPALLTTGMGDGNPVVVAAGTDDDPDGDGLSNFDEQGYRTDPLSADTDGDGLSDADEIFLWETNPCAAD